MKSNARLANSQCRLWVTAENATLRFLLLWTEHKLEHDVRHMITTKTTGLQAHLAHSLLQALPCIGVVQLDGADAAQVIQVSAVLLC